MPVDSPDELRAVLAGTFLADREVAAVTAFDARRDPAILAARIEPGEEVLAWQTARGLLDRTGRWPVAVCSFSPEPAATVSLEQVVVDVTSRWGFEQEEAGPTDPASVIERSRSVDVDRELTALAARAADEEWFEVSDPPDPSQVPEPYAPDDWFEPRDLPTALLFVPDVHPEHVLAHIHWFAGGRMVPSHVLIAVLRRWRERFGAELVAHWSTMLQLVATRPPTAVDEALALARQQELIAPCTTALPGLSTEEHAAGLLGSDRWFLHERP